MMPSPSMNDCAGQASVLIHLARNPLKNCGVTVADTLVSGEKEQGISFGPLFFLHDDVS